MITPEVTDKYNLEELQKILGSLGYQLYYTPETATTMKLAENHIKTGQPTPAVFLTNHQTQGIGREGRLWLDKAGASVLLTGLFRIKPDTLPVFADLAALDSCGAISGLTSIRTARIKYPNDLVIDDKKTGGILALNIYEGTIYLGTSVGIGINVHYTKDELAQYPTDYGATALDMHTKEINPRQRLVAQLLRNLHYLPVDALIFQTNRQFQQDQNNRWRGYSSLYERCVQIEINNAALIGGKVVDTQIGRGILLENPFGNRWFNQFDTKMKVRLLE